MKIGILGQGVSGVILAIMLKKKDSSLDITIFDHNDKTNKKLLATGNGRCNLGNLNIDDKSYNNEFAYSLYNDFDINKQREFYDSIGIMTRVLNENLVYPFSLSSQQIVSYLNKLIKEFKIKLINNVNLDSYNVNDNRVEVIIKNKLYIFDKFIFATGGKSKEALGSDGTVFKLLKKHGYLIKELKPGLSPIRVYENTKGIENERLKGKISLLIDKKIVYQEFGEILVKKDGLSGICIMNCSSIISRSKNFKKATISIDLFNEFTLEELENKFKKYNDLAGFSFLEGIFTLKMSEFIRKNSGAKNLYKFDNRDVKNIVSYVKNVTFTYKENYGFDDSQVTIGGIDLSYLKETLESKIEKNIYFVGEMLDVDGLCGGYNLMLCLASSNRVFTSLN